MKRKFTILTAALALLTFLAVPMGMRGQTRTNQTAFYGFETGDDGWTATTFVTNNTAVTAHGGSKYGATNGTTASVQYNDIVASPQSLTCYYTKTSTNTHANSHFEIQVSSNNTTWTTVATGLGMNDVTKGTWYELSADLSSYSDVYVRVRYDGTTAVRALDDITLIYDDGTTPSTDPEITFTPSSITLDEVMVGNEVSTTFSVGQANLTSDIALSVDNGSLSTSSIAQGAAATTVTWTYTPTTAGAISATVTATSGTATETLAISGTAIAPVEGYDVDFEYATDMYPNWTFNNMTTYQTGSITAHGGTYYGTTGGKATASITTKSTVANPGTLTCYVSKQSGNTTSSTWYIQVSENGSTWTDVESHSATSMSQGSWVEFTADLTDYTDVYVRVYYSGSTAIRNIDDLTLTTVEPSSDPSITAADVNIAYDAEEGTINYTINNPVEGGSIVASCDAEWIEVDDTPQTDAEGSIDFICAPNSNFYAHSATVTLTYTYGDSKATVTKDVTVTQALDPDANGSTIDYPIMVSEAIDAIDEVGSVSNIFVGGIVSEITASTSSYITFKMYDEDGDDYYLQAYHCTGNNFNEVAVGDQVVVYGTLEKYGTSVYQFASGCQLVSLIHPAVPSITVNPDEVNVDATPAAGEDFIEGTLDLTWENLEITDFLEDFAIQYYDAEGEELADDPNWIMVDLATQDPNIGEGYLVSYMIDENEGTEARTAYFKVFALGDEDYVYSNLVTITQAAPVVPPTPGNWVLTNLADLTEDDVFVIVGTRTDETYGGDYAMSNDNGTSAAPAAVAVTVAEGTLSGEPDASLQWNISITEDGYTFYPNGETETWLYCTNANNGVRVGTGEAKHFTLDEGYLTTTETTDQRYIGIYNSQDWRCYTNTTGNIVGQTFSFYKKVEPTPAGSSITVNGYGDTDGGYVLLAWPESTSPDNIEGMISDNLGAQATSATATYDLYSYDESEDKEWLNYRKNSFGLVPGKGYLYASKDGVTLTYEGEANPVFADVNNLPYTENNLVKSLYLAGNSKTTTETFYVYDGENQITFNYLVMNEDGNGFTTGQATSFEAQPLQGFFVQAPKANTTLSTTNESDADGVSLLNVQVMRNRGTVVDNAIVSFSNGPTMKKLQLFENSTKLYIPQDDEDYAIVRSEAQGELPVSFRASENGTYTLSMNVENVDMNYLHLIDNLTGMDVDLLQTPSYTFEANTNDYANRFKLVFATNSTDEADESSFAFFSNGNLIVNNEGNATLQVININGRILSSETISGSCSKAINATTGVYMLRLINGENVKVQKVVVR